MYRSRRFDDGADVVCCAWDKGADLEQTLQNRPMPTVETHTIAIPGTGTVSALMCMPAQHRACFVFAHGAGAGMDHPFMAGLAGELAAVGVGTLRYQFPYMERGARRVDAPATAHAAVRAATEAARRLSPGVPLFAGGKSFGGRMTSQAQAEQPLEGVRGLVFVGYPVHAAGKPGHARAAHLDGVTCPMLFLQGTRDKLAEPEPLRHALAPLGARATLRLFEDADHSFHVRKSSGTNDGRVLKALADAIASWIRAIGA